MKRFLSILCILCALAAIVCLSATTVLAAETDTMITDLNILVDDLVPGLPLPTPTVPEGAPYTITGWSWMMLKPSASVSATGTKEKASICENGNRYELRVEVKPIDGYTVDNSYTDSMINGSIRPNGTDQVIYAGSYTISHTWSLRTVLDRVELSYELPPVGTSTEKFAFTYDKSKVRIGEINMTEGSHDGVFISHFVNRADAEVFVGDGYEFSEDVVFVVNGQEVEKLRNRWDACSFRTYLDYDQKVSKVEFPAWPETAQPGPGGMQELPVPQNASYTLQSAWMDMRTGELVENLVSGNVYTLAYVATPVPGFYFAEETTYTQSGVAVEPMGDEQYMVLYRSYDLGAQKIDRVDITLPKLNKGCTPGNVTVAASAPYEVMETLWAESTTGSFDDAVPVDGAGFGTSVYAVPVLCAKDGYTFAEDVKLFFNGQEVTADYLYAMGNVIEFAGLYGTLTPPTTDGWYEEDNTWAYYVGGQKRTNAWIKDSIGWVYVDASGLMLKNGWAMDSVGWCYLGDDGYMVKNRWAQDSVGWCYLNADGYMVYNKWIRDSVDWCYVGKDGYMCTDEWIADSTGWCYVGADGYMVRNVWAADSQGICRLNADGYIVYNQWINDGYGWAYVDSEGYAVAEGWQRDNKGWCYIYDYYMLTDTWFQLEGKVYYVDANGYRFANGSKQYSSYTYYTFDKNGVGTAHSGWL